MSSLIGVEEHFSRIERSVDSLVGDVVAAGSLIVRDLSDYLRRSLRIEGEVVVATPSNASVASTVDQVYHGLLIGSPYRDIISTFVSDLSEQIDEFRSFYAQMRSEFNLPDVQMTRDSAELLALRASAALGALDSSSIVANKLRRVVAFSIGVQSPVNSMLQSLSDSVMDLVGGPPHIGILARDLTFSFFRNVASAHYSPLEEITGPLRYSLVGRSSETTRKFCRDGMEGQFTRDDISAMSNGQLPDAFATAGGWGCPHFWTVAGAM